MMSKLKKGGIALVAAGMVAASAAELKVGVAERELEVPLFAELYGYGPYCERRQMKIHDPLYVRAVSFFDGKKRALIIYTDTCSTDDQHAREMRARLASTFALDPAGIAFVATHTHSAPGISTRNVMSSGIFSPEFQETWKRAVMATADEALGNEEVIAEVRAGKAPLLAPIARNRVDREKNLTDPVVRWVKFSRADGTAKLLIHNYGCHGICCNGKMFKEVSADWMGCANTLIKKRKLAEMPLFLLGAAGDINPIKTCLDTGDEFGNEATATPYIDSLAADLDKGEKIDVSEISFTLNNVEVPTIRQTAAELRADAQALRETDARLGTHYWERNANRLEEMAVLTERGVDLGYRADFQFIKVGDFGIFFIPGEPYTCIAQEIFRRAKVKYPLLATVSNGNGAYFFSREIAERYPNAQSKDNRMFGFYDIYLYMHRHHFKYVDNIADFIVEQSLKGE